MADLYHSLQRKPIYWDRKSASSIEEWFDALSVSRVLYIGNLGYNTTEEVIYQLFSTCGNVTRVVMGLNKKQKCGCGFAFIQFATHQEASFAYSVLNGVRVEGKPIRCDWDSGKGIMMDRKFGRSVQGLQKRDVRRESLLHKV